MIRKRREVATDKEPDLWIPLGWLCCVHLQELIVSSSDKAFDSTRYTLTCFRRVSEALC